MSALAQANDEQTTFDLKTRRDTHWAWQPVVQTDPPEVQDAEWPTEEVDKFLLATLEQNGRRPAPTADRYTLIRRLYYDLIGLPPTPDQVDTFLQDDSDAAIERVVDQLLQSQHFGERWGRHWLDLARYAETLGHEQNAAIQNAWRYRDFVIRAYNDDVPYDQFVLEQIAGDLLPSAPASCRWT